MNSSRYIIARVLLSFGLHRKKKRLMEVADEARLLYQAEEVLGEIVWEQVEDIEKISMEYWNLRKLKIEVAKLKDLIQDADAVLNTSHQERQLVLSQTNEECQALEVKRLGYFEEIEVLVQKRDHTIAEAKLLKRQFEAAKTKIQVLSQETGKEDAVAAARRHIKVIKPQFEILKQNRDALGVQMDALNEKMKRVEEALGIDRKRLRDEASIAYQSIGKANRDVSKLTSEVVMLQNKMEEHLCEIGRYVSQNVGFDPICTQVCKGQEHLVVQIQSLRSSIALNQKLISMASD